MEHKIELCATEVPGKGIILNGISSITGGWMEHPILKKIREQGNVDIVRLLMESAIEPKVEGREKKEEEAQKNPAEEFHSLPEKDTDEKKKQKQEESKKEEQE